MQYVSLPYVEGLFENIKNLLIKYDIKAVGRTHNNLGKTVFTNTKDKTPKELNSHVVYKATCDCGVSYIGQTKQSLKCRIYQHNNDAKKQNTESHSALSNHIRTSQHTITSDNFRILEKEKNTTKRRIMEMIHIKKSNNTLNKQTDTDYLQNIYDFLLR